MRKQILAVAVLAVAATGAFAQPPAQGVPPGPGPCRHGAPDKLDPNKVQTRAEFLELTAKHFDRLDANHDGKVTPEERKSFREARENGHHGAEDGPCAGGPGPRPAPKHPGPGPKAAASVPPLSAASASSASNALHPAR